MLLQKTLRQQHQRISEELGHAAGLMKLICGVANGSAWDIAMYCKDQMIYAPWFRGRVKHEYKSAIIAHDEYRKRLIYPAKDHARLFCMQDLKDDARKRYGNITDSEYFEYWSSICTQVRDKTNPLFLCLANKYKLSLEHHSVQYADTLKWPMTALSAIETSRHLYDVAIHLCMDDYGINENVLRDVFGALCMDEVAIRWRRALMMSCDIEYDLDELESKNIMMTLDQIAEEWMKPENLYDSTLYSTAQYDDIFRTPGEQKKALRQMKETRDKALIEMSRISEEASQYKVNVNMKG